MFVQGLSQGLSVLRSLLGSDPPPTKVVDAKSADYSNRAIVHREDALVLYQPAIDANKKETPYEIVLHRPYTETLRDTYSLFRTTNLNEAEAKFCVLKDVLPILIEVNKEMHNLQGLQRICDVLAEHPSWNLAHLAAYFGLYESFKDPRISTYINSSDDMTGVSPLQVAIFSKNLKAVQVLVAANSSLEHLDHNADSVFHYAAVTNRDIIAALSPENRDAPSLCLSSRNKNGYTPLHLACQADKPECVKALLVAGADVNKTAQNTAEDMKPGYIGDFLQNHPNSLTKDDMKLGGTPLHWANSRVVIESLVDMNCHIDALNFEKRTALHIMVIRNRLECVVALLSRQADPHIGDADGNRPLHLAVKAGHVGIIQCLIVFDVDLDILNNAGVSARHLITKEQDSKILYYLHAVGAKRCPPGTPFCTDGCKHGGTYDGIPPPPVLGPTNRDVLNQMLDVAGMEVSAQKYRNGEIPKTGRLLCLDGGGIRGLILVVMLLEIEKIVGKPVSHCFDWLAGTSTGGILAIAIAAGKTMKECLCLYFRIKEQTFVGFRPYASEPLEEVLKDTFGADTVMADITHPRLMVTGVLADRKPVELHLFRNYQSPSHIMEVVHDSPYELPPPPEEQYVWAVGRATGAAPTYFRAFGKILDGGLIANNPTLDAMTEIHEHTLALRAKGRQSEATPVTMVVSLGTGVIPTTQVKEIDVFLPTGLASGIKVYTGISTLSTLLVDQATASDGRVVDRARAWCSTIGVPYFRFSPQMSEDVVMNETSDDKLCNMLWETKVYMHCNYQIMKGIADLLN